MGACAYVGLLTLLFIGPLAKLVAYGSENSLYSHIPLVPVIAGYLLYQRQNRQAQSYRTSWSGVGLLVALASCALGAAVAFRGVSENDYLSLVTLAYVSLVAAGGFLFLGAEWMRGAAFPAAFLGFMIPLPDAAAYWLERGLVIASAETAVFLFRLTGTPFLQDGTYIGLPGIVLHVANECSGIRSTWVLFITSLLASHLLLRTWWRRAVLVALVFPLGIVRNAVRIVVIGLLCVKVGPYMIDSAIHRRGGPVFFAVSLVPLFLAAIWLQRQERRRVTQPAP